MEPPDEEMLCVSPRTPLLERGTLLCCSGLGKTSGASLMANWNLMSDEATVKDVGFMLWTSCGVLDRLQNAGPRGYKKYYRRLRRQLAVVRDLLVNVEDALLNNSPALRSSRILASRAFALVEEISGQQEAMAISWFISPMFREKIVVRTFTETTAEAANLVEHLSKLIKASSGSDHSRWTDAPDADSSPSSINRLDVVTMPSMEEQILSGQKVSIPIFSSRDCSLLYAVQTWLSQPAASGYRDSMLSARVECASNVFSAVANCNNFFTLTHSSTPAGTNAPGPRPLRDQHALEEDDLLTVNITSSQGLLLGQVRSNQTNGAGGHLLRLRNVRKRTNLLRQHTECPSQQYQTELLVMESAKESCRFLVSGTKQLDMVVYRCTVAETSEVLALYIHRNNHGKLHVLSRANHPPLRDLIFCTFVALGLTSQL